jgi:hypothetical protein
VRRFRNLSFRAKALLISACFLLPIALLSVNVFGRVAKDIGFIERQRTGVVVLGQVVPVFHGLLEARNATRAMLGGFDASQPYAAARQRTDAALERLQQQLTRSGDPLQLKSAMDTFKAAWDETASARNGADANGRTVFGPVSTALVDLLAQIGDRSNLVLDSELDSFYLMNALVMVLPGTLEDVGQLWGWGTFAAVKASIGTDNEARWHVWSAGVETGVADLRRLVARAESVNPALRSRLDLAPLDAALALRKAGTTAVFDADLPKPAEYFARGQATVAEMMKLYEQGLPALDGLL